MPWPFCRWPFNQVTVSETIRVSYFTTSKVLFKYQADLIKNVLKPLFLYVYVVAFFNGSRFLSLLQQGPPKNKKSNLTCCRDNLLKCTRLLDSHERPQLWVGCYKQGQPDTWNHWRQRRQRVHWISMQAKMAAEAQAAAAPDPRSSTPWDQADPGTCCWWRGVMLFTDTQGWSSPGNVCSSGG